jgi:precorrin-2 dehydrogenase/sirohydrochlorin ferrochelatase
MPNYYPIYLNLENKRCLVVGGGEVAERKVLTLLEYAARVVVISPQLTPKLRELADEQQISWLERPYQEGDAQEAFLLVGATDDLKLHRQLKTEAEKYNLLVNIVDVPEYCNFIVPSIVKRGDLCISISTGGKSPALAKKIRRQLEQQFGPEYAEFLELMGNWRQDVLQKVPDIKQRKVIFQKMVDSRCS